MVLHTPQTTTLQTNRLESQAKEKSRSETGHLPRAWDPFFFTRGVSTRRQNRLYAKLLYLPDLAACCLLDSWLGILIIKNPGEFMVWDPKTNE